MTILKYGSHAHALQEAAVVIERENIRNERNIRTITRERWHIRGELIAASQAALTTAIQALEAAYASDGNDVGLYLSDGTTLTAHYMTSANTVGGVRVVKRPSYPEGKGAQYVYFRTYEIVLEADLRNTDDNAQYMSFIETLTFRGNGGPRYRWRPNLNGPPIRQTVNLATTQQISQRGSAMGYFGYPPIPAPLYPEFEHQDQREINYRSPKRNGTSFTEYAIDWSYLFEAGTGLAGLPNAV